MIPKLTDAMRDALGNNPDGAIEVEDDLTQRRYVLLPKEALPIIAQQELLRELQIGFDQADAGEFVEFDVDEIMAEGRRRKQSKLETS
jgi:hypothetical protein